MKSFWIIISDEDSIFLAWRIRPHLHFQCNNHSDSRFLTASIGIIRKPEVIWKEDFNIVNWFQNLDWHSGLILELI